MIAVRVAFLVCGSWAVAVVGARSDKVEQDVVVGFHLWRDPVVVAVGPQAWAQACQPVAGGCGCGVLGVVGHGVGELVDCGPAALHCPAAETDVRVLVCKEGAELAEGFLLGLQSAGACALEAQHDGRGQCVARAVGGRGDGEAGCDVCLDCGEHSGVELVFGKAVGEHRCRYALVETEPDADVEEAGDAALVLDVL